MKKISRKKLAVIPVVFYLFKVNSRTIRTRCEICSKLKCRFRNDVNEVVLVSSLLTLNRFTTSFSVFVSFEWIIMMIMIIKIMTITIMETLTDL